MQVISGTEVNYSETIKKNNPNPSKTYSVISFKSLLCMSSIKLAPIIANGAKEKAKQLLFLFAERI